LRTVAVAAGVAVLLLGAPAALAHQGNPNYRSDVKRVAPPIRGLSVTVVNFDDSLLLQNESGHNVVVLDYEDKPYARIGADHTVEVNTNSKAYYLNNDRYAAASVPAGLGSRPKWKFVSRTGRYQWHDHRIHWMSPNADPPQLHDKSVKTHILDWKVPMMVDGRPASIQGSLTWVPLPGGSMPVGLIVGLAVLVVATLALVIVVRRRRFGGAASEGEAAEAW
jgi:hypothetical protein